MSTTSATLGGNTTSFIPQIPQILKLENIALFSSNSQRGAAIAEMHDIVTTSLDRGTVSYGLRALSGLGYNVGTLREIAREYNIRGQELGQLFGHPYDKDPLHLPFFYVQNGSKFEKIDLD